ncbi:MAG: hypothetical protein Q9195_009342 [Heterodermia aff. obscurata]
MSLITILILALSILNLAKVNSQRINKPGLLPGFNGLDAALKAHLPKTSHDKVDLWSPGWILEDCKTLTEENGFSPHDIETFSVRYVDCPSPWILCRHKNSPDPLWHTVELFGRIPVRARAHIKGMLLLPNNSTDAAYNADNTIVLFNQQRLGHHDWSSLTVIMHEVGHSLDAAAYPDSQLSISEKWLAAVDEDSMVPDAYAATNVFEDVAQNTVIAAYDLNVPGGLESVKGVDWHGIRRQYELVRKEQAEAVTKNLLVPGGKCVYRVPNSQAVRINTEGEGRRRRRTRGVRLLQGKPNTDLAEGLKVIVPGKFSTKGMCPRPDGA